MDNDLRAMPPDVYRGCAVITQEGSTGPLPGCPAAAAMIRCDRRDAIVHTHVENDELVDADIREQDAGTDTVLREHERHAPWRYAGECEIAVSADHCGNTWWSNADAWRCHCALGALIEVGARDAASDDGSAGYAANGGWSGKPVGESRSRRTGGREVVVVVAGGEGDHAENDSQQPDMQKS